MFTLRTKLIAGTILAIVLFGALKYYGHIHEKVGEAKRDAFWQPKFDEAERLRHIAEARTAVLESTAKTITTDIEARHADTIKRLADRASTAERSLTSSLRRLASCSGGRQLPALPGAPADPDGAAQSDEHLGQIAAGLRAAGADCESDAAQLASLQDWIKRQAALMNSR